MRRSQSTISVYMQKRDNIVDEKGGEGERERVGGGKQKIIII